MIRKIVGLSLVITFSSGALADTTHGVLIGGGFKLESSQGQIEQNVLWLEKVLTPKLNGLDIFYGNGDKENQVDVVYWDPVARLSETRNPIADVFDSPAAEWLRYKKHEVKTTLGDISAQNITDSLTQLLPSLTDPNLLIVYNGHGGYGGLNNTDQNTLLLWHNTSMTVREFKRLLDHVPANTNSRFVLTQCYSGGFYDAVLNNNKVVPKRCGFMADGENLESEGCDLGINKDDFRDYTTYFFAALDGKTRHDNALAFNPDRNDDGRVSYFEAHLYALEAAHSSDLSRATTEIFLERWQPWFLRWQPNSHKFDNDYQQIADAVASKNNINIAQLVDLRTQEEKKLAAIVFDKAQLKKHIAESQAHIIYDLQGSYPQLMHPYTTAYTQLIATHYAKISLAIQSHQQYAELVKLLAQLEQIQVAELAQKRRITQIEKVHRLQKLALLLDNFKRYASADAQAQFSSLQQCEAGVLAP